VVGGFDSELDYMENGYPRLVNENAAFIPEDVEIITMNSIPEDIIPGKFCYTHEEGFYINPEWVEPNIYGLPNELVQQIQDDTIADLIELGVL
jgi:hypothetical protein